MFWMVMEQLDFAQKARTGVALAWGYEPLPQENQKSGVLTKNILKVHNLTTLLHL